MKARLTRLISQSQEIIESVGYKGILEKFNKKELNRIAKTIGITGYSRLKKSELVDICWGEIEGLREYYSQFKKEREESQKEIEKAQESRAYISPLDFARPIYGELRELFFSTDHKKKVPNNYEERQEMINALAGTIARRMEKLYGRDKIYMAQSTIIKTYRVQVKKQLLNLAKTEVDPINIKEMTDAVNLFYSALCGYQKEISIEINTTYEKEIKSKQFKENKEQIEALSMVDYGMEIYKKWKDNEKVSWVELDYLLMLVTGRRSVEIHCLGEFKAVGKYELHFSGQAKTRDSDLANHAYNIPCLIPAKDVVATFEERHRAIAEKFPYKVVTREEQARNGRASNYAIGKDHSRLMARFKYLHSKVNAKLLRKIYAELAARKFNNGDNDHVYFSLILGHIQSRGSTTFESYMYWDVEDIEECLGLL